MDPSKANEDLQNGSPVIAEPRGDSNEQDALDWEQLRQQSLQPGGFGEERKVIWPKLLGVDLLRQAPATSEDNDNETTETGEVTLKPHPDENQIKLDTNRSFVMYPVAELEERDTLKDGLHELLISIFRRRPKLSYFQGYHDIATVLYLTLPPEACLVCTEKLSLHRIRDCMVSTLDPVVGLLRVTKNLIRLADPEYAKVLEGNSPLPFFALSNLMTLFSHDMPTLPLIQHVFDYLLCRPPIAIVYLTVTIILTRKEEVLRLQQDGDEGMIHSLLNSLPDIVDETVPAKTQSSDSQSSPSVIPEEPDDFEDRSGLTESEQSQDNDAPTPPSNDPACQTQEPVNISGSEIIPPPPSENGEIIAPPGHKAAQQMRSLSTSPAASRSRSPRRRSSLVRSRSSTLSRGGSQSDSVPSLPHLAALISADGETETEPESPTTVVAEHSSSVLQETRRATLKPRLTLSGLLGQADELYTKFPPDHPDLHLSSIMGPQSVVFTWKESLVGGQAEDEEAEEAEEGTEEERDAEAEAMVLHPELIVYPYMPEPDTEDTKEEDSVWSEVEEQGMEKKGKRRRRKLQKARRFDRRTKTIVAGALVVLGVSVAIYGMRAQRGAGGSVNFFPHAQKKWSQSRQWFGSALAGATAKWMQELGIGGGGHGEL
ncbi:hypothetical protein H1R20_g14794, partial [Candolleomyces eurysporus]